MLSSPLLESYPDDSWSTSLSAASSSTKSEPSCSLNRDENPSNSPTESSDNLAWVEFPSVLSISESLEDNSVLSSSLFDSESVILESVSSEVSCSLCLPKRNRKRRLFTTAFDRFAGHSNT